MIEVSLVPTQFIDTCWAKIEPFMERAAKYTYGRYTSDDIYDDYDPMDGSYGSGCMAAMENDMQNRIESRRRFIARINEDW